MDFDKKRMVFSLQVGGEVRPQLEEVGYLRVLFTNEGRLVGEIVKWISAACSVMQRIMVTRELSCKPMLLIYRSVYVPTLSEGHELWVNDQKDKIADTNSQN